VLLATSSEETGSELGSRWVIEQHPELVGRFWALLTEGGVNEAVDDESIKYWGISFAQKHFVRLQACSASRGQLEQLRASLLEHEVERRVLTLEARAFLEAYGPTRVEPMLREIASKPELAVLHPWCFGYLPAYLRALYRNEAHPLPVVADPDTGGYRLTIVLHLLPGEDLERARAEVLPEWMIHGVRVVVEEEASGAETTGGSPLDHEAFRRLVSVVRERHEEATVGPYFLPFYDNDARFFRSAGVPSYGFSPFVSRSTDTFTVGGVDERITVPAFLDGVALYREAVFSLIGWDAQLEELDKK
jgi:acetylornithine deacetylase/succinyl-diaminopimelate desuccinylase-like protein